MTKCAWDHGLWRRRIEGQWSRARGNLAEDVVTFKHHIPAAYIAPGRGMASPRGAVRALLQHKFGNTSHEFVEVDQTRVICVNLLEYSIEFLQGNVVYGMSVKSHGTNPSIEML